MTIRPPIHAAIDSLRSHRIVFEPGLTDDEVARAEGVGGFHFPPDLRLFLQTALPVTGGFPNWRSESEKDLHHRYLDPPSRGVLFDVEHNDFWPEEWGPRPADLADALAMAGRRLTEAPPLIPVRSHHFLPASPSAKGNPVFSVRQTDVACVGRDLPSYLTGLFDQGGHAQKQVAELVIPFWSEVARTSRVRVPNLAGPFAQGMAQDYERLRQSVRRAGFWAEVITLANGGAGVEFDHHEPTGGRKHGVFWVARKEFGWLLCVRCPRYYFAPYAERIPELCLTLLNRLPHEALNAGCLPFGNFRLDEAIRRDFGLTAIHHFTNYDDERERKLRAWERLGWREMSHGQEDEAWKAYEERTGQRRGVFTTPMPSVTWDISPIYLRGREHMERLEDDLTLKALEALKKCTRPGEELLALDWNHPCYFFDPHAGVSDAQPSSWAVPVLPNGDHYIFLAQDFRFGFIGNCVDMTICVFGQQLLAAIGGNPPSIFNKPTWTYEDRREKERFWAEQGWQRLTVEEKEDIWERFDSQFGFYQRRARLDSPAIAEPTPSRTWAIASDPSRHEAEVADLTLKFLASLRRVTKPGERLYAIDSLHWYEHYTFDPRRLESAGRNSWALPVYPDDNFAIVLAPDFRFGAFGNPLEKSFCIFGQELLGAMGDDLPLIFGRLVRKNGKAVSV